MFTEATFKRSSVDGNIKTTFKWKDEGDTSGNPPPVFHTMMITLGDKEQNIPVHFSKIMERLSIQIRSLDISYGMWIHLHVSQSITAF